MWRNAITAAMPISLLPTSVCAEKKEQKKADKIFDILTEKGWEVEQEEECASIRVYDRNEYKELVEDYKRAKEQ